MIDYCKRCDKRDTCTKLCATAMEYADQDYVGQDYWLVERSMDSFSNDDKIIPEYGDVSEELLALLTKKQAKIIDMVFNQGLSLRVIADELNIHFTSVDEHITLAKNKLRKKLENPNE